jgi:hypothetical protein
MPFILLTGGYAAAGGAAALALSIAVIVWRGRRHRSGSAAPGPGPQPQRLRHARRIMVRLALASVVTAVGAGIGSGLGIKPPSQADVVARFREHRREFEALREMVLADKLRTVFEGGRRYAREPFGDWPSERVGIDGRRAEEYRRMLGAVGWVSAAPEGRASFLLASWGAANHGWRLSVGWLPEPPSATVPTIDGLGTTRGDVVYSHIEDNWYIAFVW